MGTKTYQSWRHVIKEFSSRVSFSSLASLIGIVLIPRLLFLNQNQDLAEFNVYTYAIISVFVGILIGSSFWTTLTPWYRKNTGFCLCFELSAIAMFMSFTSYPHEIKGEEKTLVFLIYYFTGLIQQVFLMFGIINYEKWEGQNDQKLIHEFVKDFRQNTSERVPNYDLVPRCKDFKELYKVYISKESEARLAIPEEDFKVLEEKYLKNEIGANDFLPALDYSLKVINDCKTQ